MDPNSPPTETKEEFQVRYPRPSDKRVLVRCFCHYERCTGWCWGWKDDLDWDQELVE